MGQDRLNRKEKDARLVSAWLGATAVALPAGAGMLAMAVPAGLAGATLIGGWFAFSGALGLFTFASLLSQAHGRSPGGNFHAKSFFKGLAASALVCGGIMAGMVAPMHQAFNEQARAQDALTRADQALSRAGNGPVKPAAPVQKP
jgi:hypothetical protein